MGKKFGFHRSQGFSLIEVLVAVTILSVGLLALATLQIALVRASAETKAQSQALALGKDQLELLRSYTDLAGYQGLTSSSDSKTVGGVLFNRTWTVTRYVFNQDVDADGILNETNDQAFQSTGTLTGATPTSPAGFVANNEFKVINVDTDWTAASGSVEHVYLVDAIGAISPNDSTLIAKTAATILARKIPVVIKNPGLDNMVIPIAIGNGNNSAATNPKPQIVIGTSLVETKFDVLTYGALTRDGSTATAQQRVETVMVGCTCDFGQAPASTVRGKRPTYWDGTRYTVPVSTTYAPPAGVDTASVNLQSPRCDICCRDHNDPVGATGALFSPLQATRVNGTVTVAHKHFTSKVSPATTTGTFKEACRLIRIDGQWRVAADLYNDYFALLATGNGTTADTFIPDSTSVRAAITSPVAYAILTGGAVARYQLFVKEYLAARFITPSPSTGNEQSTYNSVGNPQALSITPPYVLDNPTSIAMNLVATDKWLHARGVYVDYLEQDAVNAITNAKVDSACTVDLATKTNCILKLLPFTSINLTEIADWAPLAGPPIRVADNNYGSAAWNNNVAYALGQVVTNGGQGYVALVAHTSTSSFATDLGAGKWVLEAPAWVASTSYALNAIVSNGGVIYTSQVAHTSGGSFGTDLTAGKWLSRATFPIRGLVTTNASAGTTVDVSALGRKSNTGLLDLSFDSISPNDDTPLTDTQSIAIAGGAALPTPGNGSFPVIWNYTGASVTKSTAYYTTGTVASKSCGSTTSPFPCTVDNGSVSAGLDVAGGISIDVGGYNHQQNVTTTTKLSGCLPTGGAVGTLNSDQSTAAPGVLQSYTGSVCKNYEVTSVTSTSPAYGTATWVAAPSSDGNGQINPAPGEVTRINFTGAIASSRAWVTGTAYAIGNIVTNGGNTYTATVAHTSGATFATDLSALKWTARTAISITVNFGVEAQPPYQTQSASSCTYSCGQLDSSNRCRSNKPTTFTALYPACP